MGLTICQFQDICHLPMMLNTLLLMVCKTVKGLTMKNSLLDYLAAIAIGLMLCIGALHYFDVLVK